MNAEDRFVPYFMQVEGDKLLMYESKDCEPISHELRSIIFVSYDSEGMRAVDKTGRLFSIILLLIDGRHQKVYFTTF